MFPASETGAGAVRPAASLYAVVRSSLAWATDGLAPKRIIPFTVPGGNPVTADPGLTPRFAAVPAARVTCVGRVLVTVEPARIGKSAAESRFTAPGARPGPAADSTYVTTGRPSAPTATDGEAEVFPLGSWLRPLPDAEPPSSCQNALTPASAKPMNARTRATVSRD